MSARAKFENYITQNLDEVFRFAYMYTKNKEYAEDVISESIVRALSSAASLKKTEYVKTWFYRIVINTANTYMKKQSRTVNIESAAERSTEDDYSEINLGSMFSLLDDKMRIIVTMRYLEDMKIAEIAKVLGENENTVKTRLYKALKILRADLEV